MNTTWIILRLPGFYAVVESRLHQLKSSDPLLVIMGEGARALILSVSPEAYTRGARPGMRLVDLPNLKFRCIPADPHRYQHANAEILRVMHASLPSPFLLRYGFFASEWTGGVRFLEKAVNEADELVRQLGFHGAWGIGATAAVAEIAAIRAKPGQRIQVKSPETPVFLASQSLEVLHDLDKSACDALHTLGIHTLGQLSAMPLLLLREMFGSEGLHLRNLARHGIRPAVKNQWRGVKRLSGDEDNPTVVNRALTGLISQGLDELTAINRQPASLWITIQYSDSKRASGRLDAAGMKHEGNWQHAAIILVNQLWKRRVRLAEIRVLIRYGLPVSQQLCLFNFHQHEEKMETLSRTLREMRSRWGGNVIHFAPNSTILSH